LVDVNFDGQRGTWDAVGHEIGTQQDRSLQARKKLAEITKGEIFQ